MRKRNFDSWKLLIDGYLGEDKTFDADLLEFYERYTAEAVANTIIEWAKRGMKAPPERMAYMDHVATRGIYGLIDAANEPSDAQASACAACETEQQKRNQADVQD